MKRPLGIVALCYVTGIILGSGIGGPLGFLFLSGFLVSGAVWLLPSRGTFLLPALVMIAGWTNFQLQTDIVSPRDLRVLLGQAPQLVTLQGVLLETPTLRVRHIQGRETPQWRSSAHISVTTLQTDDSTLAARGRIIVSTRDLLSRDWFAGQQVELSGVLHPPREADAPGLFDYRRYLSREGIYFQLDVESPNDWKKRGRPQGPSLADRFFAWGKEQLQRGLPTEDTPLHLLWAMTLGWKTGLSDEVSEPFMASGTMHIFAISGLHIALLSGILLAVLRVIRLPRMLCGCVIIPLLWFYTAATGWQASAVRSTVMMTIVIGGWSLSRPADLLNSLSAAALVILLLDPQQLFQAGFQLSFLVVFAIAVLMPALDGWRDRILRNDPFLPDSLQPRWQRWTKPAGRAVAVSLATSLAAWLGSLPLIAWYFHLVTPVSLLANVLVVPLSSLALMGNLGSLLCGDWAPAAGVLFNEASWFFMSCMMAISSWCASLPGAFFYVPAPPPAAAVLFYLLVFGLCKGWFSTAPHRKVAWPSAAALLILMAWQTLHFWNETTVVVVPVGGGNFVWVDRPGRKNDLLIDCGNQSSYENVTRPFLRAQGVNKLENFLVTHGDVRQMGGAPQLLTDFSPRVVYHGATRQRSAAYRQILERIPERTLTEGQQFCQFKVLHPKSDHHFTEADDNALVLLADFQGVRLLFLSDLGRAGQEALLQTPESVEADIVISGRPLHGEPLSPPLLKRIRPQLIILADHEHPVAARGSKALLRRLDQSGVPVLFGRRTGPVTIRCRPTRWEAETMHSPIVLRSPSLPPPTSRHLRILQSERSLTYRQSMNKPLARDPSRPRTPARSAFAIAQDRGKHLEWEPPFLCALGSGAQSIQHPEPSLPGGRWIYAG